MILANHKQRKYFKELKDHMKDHDNIIDESLMKSMAMLLDTIEQNNKHIEKHGHVIKQTGDKGQDRFVPNPAVAQRDAAIKQMNVLIRTMKIDTNTVKEESALGDFLKG